MRRIRQRRPGHVNLGIITEVEEDGVTMLGGKFRKRKKTPSMMAQDIIDNLTEGL